MAILGLLGVLLFLVGWIWMMVIAVKQGGALWGILVFFFSWIAGIVFAITKKAGWTQVGLMILGFILMIAGGAITGSVSMETP